MLNRLPTLLFIALMLPGAAFAADRVLIFAAASTHNALSSVVEQYRQNHPDSQVKLSFASSSTLAKQIFAGAPAELYISANPKWMDYLEKQELIHPNSRFDLLANRVVMIAPKDTALTLDSQHPARLPAIAGKFCMGDPMHVPVGIYGKQALNHMGWWPQIKQQTVAMKDVRAALALVERAECDAGIVYSTDARASDQIKTLMTFPAEAHDPIVYPAAAIGNISAATQSFLDFLKTSRSQSIFQQYGFATLP